MNKIIFKYISMGLLLCFFGCGDNEVDITPPSMEVVRYVPEPVEELICGTQDPTVFLLTGGDQLSFEVIFEDNEALSQYKVDIHNNFDCHGHGGGSAPSIAVPNVDNLTVDWTVLDIGDISGMSSHVTRIYNVPDNVTAGNYHYHIQVVDESGNDNPAANFFSLKIKNPLDSMAPNIIVTEPSSSDFEIKRGESIRFAGTVTDNRSLSDGGNGILYLSYTNLSSGNSFSTDQAFAFDKSVDREYDFDFEYTIPRTWKTGPYRLSLGANDGVRNVAEFKFFELEVRD